MSTRWPTGIRARVLVLISAVVIAPLGLLIVDGLSHRTEHAEAIRAEALHRARLVAQEQHRRLEGARQFLLALSRASDVRDGDTDRCTAYVRSLAFDHRGTYDDIGLADRDGRIVCHALETSEPVVVADRTYFRRALATGEFTVGDYMIGRASGVPRIAFSYPVRDDDGRIRGVLFASTDLRALSATLRTQSIPHDGTIAVLDRNGTVVARSAPGSIGTTIPQDRLRRILERGELTAEYRPPDGTERVYGAATLRDARGAPVLVVTVGLRRDLAMAAGDRRLTGSIVAFLVLGLATAGLAWYGAEVLVRRPIAELVGASVRLASGELQTRVHAANGVHEVADLARVFNAMAEKVQYRELRLMRGQRLEAVGHLAGRVARDFHALLTSIRADAAGLRTRIESTAGAPEALDGIESSTERATRLAAQLLAFSRRETREPQPIRLNDVVLEIHDMIQRISGEDIRLVVELAPDLGLVNADPAELQQVILNLVANARDAMPAGGTLTIETANEEMHPAGEFSSMVAAACVVLRVTDTGCGMDWATRARLGEPFFSTKGEEAAGLGLAIAYASVKEAGGAVGCESEIGQGTCLTIWLPHVAHSTPAVSEEYERVLV